MKKFFDLRFVIGLFFLTIGILVFIHSLVATPVPGYSEKINLYSSLFFILFGVVMLFLSRDKKPMDNL